LSSILLHSAIWDFQSSENRDENGSNTHGTEPSCENGFSESLDIGNPFVGGEYDWNPTKEEDKDGEYY
jgi:hypothetical protein